jgi:ABC-type nitrate/sulfonate/bicarbonate transport system permease component
MKAQLQGAVVPGGLILAWELVWHVDAWRMESLSRPTQVAQAFVATLRDGSLVQATVQTLHAALLGFVLASLVGIAVGIVIGLSPRLERVVAPTIDALRPIPSIALIPLSLMIFGFGAPMEATVVAFACIWPVLLVTVSSVKGIESRLIEVSDALQFGFWQRTTKIVIPAAVAGIVVGLRLALAIALIVAITVEIVINPRGLGHEMMAAQQALQFDRMYANLLWVGLLGWGISAATMAGVRRIPGVRLGAGGNA